MRLFSILLLLVISMLSFAQDDDVVILGDDRMSDDDFDIRDIRNNFHLGLITTYYIDFATSPVNFSEIQVGFQPDPNDPNNTIPRFEEVPFQSLSVSYFSFGIEPRLNLFQKGPNLAAGISAPLTIGIGQSGPANEFVNGVVGLGNIQVPLHAKVYLGQAATDYSTENFGINVGVGYELNKIAIIPIEGTEAEINANKAWIMPSAALGFNFYRGRSPMEVNIKYGFGKPQTITNNGGGGSIPSGSRNLKASSIKLSFIYLL